MAVPLQHPESWRASQIRMFGYERPTMPEERWILGLPSRDPNQANELMAQGRAMWAGWHCQYCFPPEEYIKKALAVCESTGWERLGESEILPENDAAHEARVMRSQGRHPKWALHDDERPRGPSLGHVDAGVTSFSALESRRALTTANDSGVDFAPAYALSQPRFGYLVSGPMEEPSTSGS